jgi:hypothetical protein
MRYVVNTATLAQPVVRPKTRGEVCGAQLKRFRSLMRRFRQTNDARYLERAVILQQKIKDRYPDWVYLETLKIVGPTRD